MAIAMKSRSEPPAQPKERRSHKCQTMVLRVGVLIDDQRTSFCLVKNISADGVEVKTYAPVKRGADVRLTVGDEALIGGQVAWVRGQRARIKFEQPLDPHRLLRATQKPADSGRRSSPRVNVAARAILRVQGQAFAAELADISAVGARVNTCRQLSEGGPVSLMLPDMPAIMAFVRWSKERVSGLVFHTPIPMQTLAPWLAQRLRVSP